MTIWLGDEEEDFSVAGWNHINLELVPHAHDKVTTNLIWSGFKNEWDKVKNFDPSNNWHEYDIRWTPDHITFIIDGVERRREIHLEDDFNEALHDLSKKQHILMNFWTPEWAQGHLDPDTDMPWYTRYEYVKAYDWLGNENGEDEFQLRWEEHFEGDHLNEDRWAYSTHSNGESKTTFVPQNAYVENGQLVLKMEHKDRVQPEPRRDEPVQDQPKEPEKPDGHDDHEHDEHRYGDAEW